MDAWQGRNGTIWLWKEQADSYHLRLPCGNCLGCRMASAQAWALRCQLELQQHRTAVFTTLTYNDDKLPPTLNKRDIQLWIKRLRKKLDTARTLRFFASGEYGEHTERPHYHAILYGLDVEQRDEIERAWGKGHTYTKPVTPANIAYTAGYTSKKIGYKRNMADERVDPTTGEVYQWQPPFIQMSRRPGIGGHARQWVDSWRLYAIQDGHRQPVPRFYNEAWKAQATPTDKEELLFEKQQLALGRDTTTERLEAAEKIAVARQAITADKRNY